MAIVIVYQGSLSACKAVADDNTGSHRIGLFQNDWQPQPNQSISAVVPATFSGYDGLHDLLGWTLPVMIGDQAVSYATQRVWTHNGGPVSNWIYGIYVVDSGGNLRWAERVWNEPIALALGGNFVSYTPTLTMKSYFDGL